jgi:predicted AAA+ superfamily ATPase
VPEIASLTRPNQIPRLLQFAAQLSGNLLNLSEIGRSVALDHKTTDSYLRVLEQLFLVCRLQPWSRNELSRIVKTPKLHLLDSGLLTTLHSKQASLSRLDETATADVRRHCRARHR